MSDPKTTAEQRYEVRTDGVWSFIFDTQAGKLVSHGYDIECDADIEAERLNVEAINGR